MEHNPSKPLPSTFLQAHLKKDTSAPEDVFPHPPKTKKKQKKPPAPGSPRARPLRPGRCSSAATMPWEARSCRAAQRITWENSPGGAAGARERNGAGRNPGIQTPKNEKRSHEKSHGNKGESDYHKKTRGQRQSHKTKQKKTVHKGHWSVPC